MKKRIMKAVLILSCLIILAGCAVGEKERGTSGAGGQSEGLEDDSQSQTQEDDDIYQTDYINIEESEKQTINERISDLGSLCKDIYVNADKGESSNIVLQEDVVHEMVQTAASRGLAVTCGSYDYNMLNYETVDQALNNAAEGGKTETEFHEITASGYFKYFKLSAKDQELTVTYANASYNDDLEMQIRQMEKFRVYDWEYTEKGWLIWEKALSKNQEMDMHSFFRVLPLDEKCRELGNQYILPVSYFGNNLLLTDWDADSMDQIEFNDLYEFLYEIKYGEKLNEENVQNGIPKEQFEDVICAFFDISTGDLEVYARYDAETGLYPWEPVGPRNRVSQFLPFPEVVKCVENADGTWTLYVEGIMVIEGDDCTFKHTVTMKERDGGWIYMGNDVNEEGSDSIPAYKPRREF